MLARKNCLKKKKDFEKVFKGGKSFKESFLFLKYILNSFQENRFGIIVSKKISKKSVIRNKIKRKIKAAILQIMLENKTKSYSLFSLFKKTKVKKGIDCIFVVLPGLENKNFWEIKEIINKILIKSKILKNN